MGVLFDWESHNWVEGTGITSYPATDGIYVWFVARNSSQTYYRLYRLRHSDKALIKPDGSVGNSTNAYVDLPGGGWGNDNVGLATDGTYVLVSGQTAGMSAYRCSDMTQALAPTAIPLYGGGGNGPGCSCWKPHYFGGYFWTTGFFPSPAIYRVTPGTWATVNIGGGGIRYNMVWDDGTDLWLRNYQTSTTPLAKFTTAGTKVFDITDSEGGSLVDACYDPTRGHMFFTGSGYEHVRVRVSDGAPIDATGAVVATVPLAKVKTAYKNGVVGNGGGIFVAEDVTHVSASGTGPAMQRRNLLNSCSNVGGQAQSAAIANNVVGFVAVENTVYAATGNLGGLWSVTGLMWTEYTAASPVLLQANPNGNGLDVVFDSAVGVGTPSFGAATTKLAVTGASQTAGSTLHLVVDPITPQLTTAAANGTGIDLVFDKPVNVAAVPSYGGIANNLQVTLAAPVSGTEIQLTANAIAPQITTAKANASGIDLVFDRPVDLAAIPDYGTTVNNLKVVTANPLSTTEVQLFTTISSNTYEWLPAPVNVTGVGILPYVATAYARDMTTFVLIFSEEVTESSARNIGNYAISPALDILGIVKMNSTTYAMTTSQQTANTVYHVTLTGVIDPANNPI